MRTIQKSMCISLYGVRLWNTLHGSITRTIQAFKKAISYLLYLCIRKNITSILARDYVALLFNASVIGIIIVFV